MPTQGGSASFFRMLSLGHYLGSPWLKNSHFLERPRWFAVPAPMVPVPWPRAIFVMRGRIARCGRVMDRLAGALAASEKPKPGTGKE